jgi:hypothetical protein
MMIYVSHSKETSQLCAKLLIKRKPVEFTKDERCTRLKTTPFRERPHKCFFVHEGENRTLFKKCSHDSSTSMFQSTNYIFMWILIVLFHYIRT